MEKSGLLRKISTLVPLLLLILLIFLYSLLPARIEHGFMSEPPLLNFAFKAIFVLISPFAVAYLAGRGYVGSGNLTLFFLGAGSLTIFLSVGLSALVLAPGGHNLSARIHNCGSLLAGILYFAGALFASSGLPLGKATLRIPYLLLAYAGVTLAVLMLALLPQGYLPDFYIQGIGPTPLRQMVVGSAAILFAVTGCIFIAVYHRTKTAFLCWYSLALLLYATGLLGVFLQTAVGGQIGWAGRSAQYIAGICFFVAVFQAVKTAKGKNGLLDAVFSNLFSRPRDLYKVLVQATSDAVIVIDAEERVLLWNSAAEKLFGYGLDEALGTSLFELVGPGRSTDALARIIRNDLGEGPVEAKRYLEFEARTKSGARFPVEASVSKAVISDQTIRTLILRDFSERKRVEEELRESKAQLAAELKVASGLHELGTSLLVTPDLPTAAKETLDAVITLVGADKGTMQFYDRPVKELKFVAQSGFDPAMLRGLPVVNSEYHSTCGRALRVGERVIVDNFETDPAAQPHRSTAELLGYRAAYSTPLMARSGEVVGMLTVHFCRPHHPSARELRLVDLYGRQAAHLMIRARTEEVLQRKEAQLREAQRIAHIGSWCWDANTKTESVSEEMKHIFAADPEQPFPAFKDQKGRLYTLEDWESVNVNAQKTLNTGVGFELDLEPLRVDGTPIWITMRGEAVRDGEGRIVGLQGTVQDVTEQKRVEEALMRYRDELELRVKARTAELQRRNQELQEFAFVASHDLSEPLRKIKTFGELVQKNQDRLDENGKDYLRRMVDAANRMQNLLDALLVYSRVTTRGKDFEPVDLNRVAREAQSDLELAMREAEARVEIDPLPTLAGDPEQLRQLFQNLIGNALKYRRLNVEPVIKVHGNGDGRILRIFVEDNGIGFEEKYLDKIFLPFQRLHGRTQYEGLGMGLAICKKIVERHKGAIAAKSAPGKGSTFIVTLPVNQIKTRS